MPPKPGRVTRTTPAKPTRIAHQRRQPTHSPKIGPDNSATKNGVENRIAVVWSSCSQRSAKKFNIVEPSSRIERAICSHGRDVFINTGRDTGLDKTSARAKPAAYRAHTTCKVSI